MGKLNKIEEIPTFIHFSHEHPLELTSLDQPGNPICSGCNMDIVAGRDYYSCKACAYSLHRICYNMPRIFVHPAHPSHDLNLLLSPSFECKACGLQGSGFSYNCSVCLVHYHTVCAFMPPKRTHNSHPHMLNLEFSPPYENPKAFSCDICGNPGFDHWLYRCGECEFDVHLTCATAMNSSPRNTPPAVVNRSLVVQPDQNYINNYHSQRSRPASGIPTVPANNINGMNSSTSTPPGNQVLTYVNPTPVMQSSGGYGFNQGTYLQQQNGMGMGFPHVNQVTSYPNQQGFGGSAQGVLGAGVAAVVVGGVLTGIGEGIGQEICQGVLDGFVDG